MEILAKKKINVYPKNVTVIELQRTVRSLLKDNTNYCVKFDEEYDNMLNDGSLVQSGMTVNKIPLLKLADIKTPKMEIVQYNNKGFLLPDSIKSMAAYHAKIMPDGKYLFRLHDCISGVRLIGDLNDPVDVEESISKLEVLSEAAKNFADFIKTNYYNSPKKEVKTLEYQEQ